MAPASHPRQNRQAGISPRGQESPPVSNPLGWPAFMRVQTNDVYLSVKLQPRASKNEIDEPLGAELRIRVTAPPVDAAANEALLRLLAQQLDCSRSAVQLIRGHTSRHKIILIRGLTPALIMRRLSSQK